MLSRFACIATILVAALYTSAAQAETTVVPAAYALTEGFEGTIVPLASVSSTLMQLYGESELTALTPGMQITAIGFRLNGLLSSVPTVTFADYDIYMGQLSSTITNPARNAATVGTGGYSTTFADNYQAGTRVQVRGTAATTDSLTLTNLIGGAHPDPIGSASPNPFFTITLDNPYTYEGGGIIFEIRHSTSSTNSIVTDSTGSNTINGSTLLVMGSSTAVTARNYLSGSGSITQFTTTVVVPEANTAALLGLVLPMIGAVAVVRRRKKTA